MILRASRQLVANPTGGMRRRRAKRVRSSHSHHKFQRDFEPHFASLARTEPAIDRGGKAAWRFAALGRAGSPRARQLSLESVHLKFRAELSGFSSESLRQFCASRQPGLALSRVPISWLELPFSLLGASFPSRPSHSSSRTFLGCVSDIGILPHSFYHLSSPFSSRTKFSRSIPKPVLSSCRLYTGCHRVRKQVSPRLILEHSRNSSFDGT